MHSIAKIANLANNRQRVGENVKEIIRCAPCKVAKLTKMANMGKMANLANIFYGFGEYSN